MTATNLRTPYTTLRAKTVQSASRQHPGRLGRAELDDLLADDQDDSDLTTT
jgi:hypothetical protein